MSIATTAATDSSTETAAAVVASPPSDCWDHVQRTGLLERCSPENRYVILAAYRNAYAATGDAAPIDDTPYSTLADDALLSVGDTSVWMYLEAAA